MRQREEEGQGKRKREERKLEGVEKDMGNLGEENKEGERERDSEKEGEECREVGWGKKGRFFGGPCIVLNKSDIIHVLLHIN